MSKYEWTKKEIEEVIKECPPENRQYVDAFLNEVQSAGESLTRVKFFELLEKCSPSMEDDVEDCIHYELFNNHFKLSADFSEAWNIPKAQPLPRITTTSKYGRVKLPDDFCTLGGSPEWIQNADYPICGECDANMVVFLQLKSLPYDLTRKHKELEAFTFGDAGNFYLFQCPNCGTCKTSWECH